MANILDFLKDLAQGRADISPSPLATPVEALMNLPGGVAMGTRDFLGGQGVGDRPVVEQLLRTVGGAAALNAGVGPFLAVQDAFSKQAQQDAALMQSPALHDAFRQAEARFLAQGMTTEEAQRAALDSIRQAFPGATRLRFGTEGGPAIDARPSALPGELGAGPTLGRGSVLPALPAEAQLKQIKEQTLLEALIGPAVTPEQRLQRVRAKYEHAGLTPPLSLQAAEGQLTFPKVREGQETDEFTLRDGKLTMKRATVPPNARYYPDGDDGIGSLEAQAAIDVFNQRAYAQQLPTRAIAAPIPGGTVIKFIDDPFVASVGRATGSGAVEELIKTGDPAASATLAQQGQGLIGGNPATQELVEESFVDSQPLPAAAATEPAPRKGSELRAEERAAREREAASHTPTPAQREVFAKTSELRTGLENLKAEFENANLGALKKDAELLGLPIGRWANAITGGQPTGVLAGRLNQQLKKVGLTTKTLNRMMALQASVQNAYIKAITGAQLSREEAVRIGRQLPLLEQHPETFLTNLEVTLEQLDALEQARQEQFDAGVPFAPITDTEATALLGRMGFTDEDIAAAVTEDTTGTVTVIEDESGTITLEQ